MKDDALKFLQLIEEYPIITIFRHSHPDCDASGSQFGLKKWIIENFPSKQVYACGKDACMQGNFPETDQIDDAVIQNSLAIVLDTGNIERVDDLRFQLAKYILKIDHHPNVTPYGNTMIVIEEAAATCEIITNLFMELPQYKVSKEIAEYLYKGLLTDTLCFKTSNTRSNTLRIASFLTQFDISIPDINRELFDISLDQFKFINYLRSRVNIDGGLASICFSKEELNTYQITPRKARDFISEIGNIKEFEIWCIFTERLEDSGIYDGSLRSKTIPINDVATHFNGGGHRNASGVKDLSLADIDKCLKELKEKI